MLSIIFVCTHNRCRSILFEAVANHVGQGKIIAKSAGSAPENAVHPKAIKYLQKAGIETTNLYNKPLAALQDFKADVIITVCDNAQGEACPIIFSETPKVHWGLSDPSKLPESQQDAAFTQTMALMKTRIEALLVALDRDDIEIIDALNEMGDSHG